MPIQPRRYYLLFEPISYNDQYYHPPRGGKVESWDSKKYRRKVKAAIRYQDRVVYGGKKLVDVWDGSPLQLTIRYYLHPLALWWKGSIKAFHTVDGAFDKASIECLLAEANGGRLKLKRRDTTNFLKATEDAIYSHFGIDDSNNFSVVSYRAPWFSNPPRHCVIVDITPHVISRAKVPTNSKILDRLFVLDDRLERVFQREHDHWLVKKKSKPTKLKKSTKQ